MSEPLEILHVCPLPGFSGLEQYALNLAFGQKQLGHRVSFLALPDSPLARRAQTLDLALDLALDVWELGIGAHALGAWPRLGAYRDFLKRFAHWAQADSGEKILHLHSTQDLTTMLWPLFKLPQSARQKIKVILQTHIWLDHNKRDPLHALAYSFVDEIWCSSEPAKNQLLRILPISKKCIRVVNYGRNVTEMEEKFLPRVQAREALGLPRESTFLVSVARIDEGKGTRELLEGTLPVLKAHSDLHLVLIGGATATDGKARDYADGIRATVAHLPDSLKARVHLLGEVPNSFQYLKAFDLFVLPSYKECFALSLLEAMLAGLPVLGTDSGGTPEVVRENETGWLFAPRSASAVTDSLSRALQKREQWLKLGQTAAARVRRDFDFTKVLSDIILHYYEETK